MKQSGNTIQNDHLQEFLDSATNAARLTASKNSLIVGRSP